MSEKSKTPSDAWKQPIDPARLPPEAGVMEYGFHAMHRKTLGDAFGLPSRRRSVPDLPVAWVRSETAIYLQA